MKIYIIILSLLLLWLIYLLNISHNWLPYESYQLINDFLYSTFHLNLRDFLIIITLIIILMLLFNSKIIGTNSILKDKKIQKANKIFDNAYLSDSMWDYERIKKYSVETFIAYNNTLLEKNSTLIKRFSSTKGLGKVDSIINKKLTNYSYMLNSISIKYISVVGAKDIEGPDGDKVTIEIIAVLRRYLENNKNGIIYNPLVHISNSETIEHYIDRLQSCPWEYNIYLIFKKSAGVWLLEDIKDRFIDKL